MNVKKSAFLLLCLAIVSIFIFSPIILAQDKVVTPSSEKESPVPTRVVPPEASEGGLSLFLSPAFVNLNTDPGKTASSQFKVINRNNNKEYLKIQIAKFSSSNGGAQPNIEFVDNNDEFAQWVSLSDKEFILEPNGEKTIKFSINTSKDAALGYYYALVVNRIQENTGKKGGAIVNIAPALPVILEVNSPNAKKELQLVDIKATKSVYEYLPAEIEITVKNTGNIHVVPFGDVFIDQGSKKNVDTIKANLFKGNILPGEVRTYTASWDNGFPVRVPKKENGVFARDKKGNVVYETKWDFTKLLNFRIGKYTSNVLMVYDNGERDVPLEGNVSFWVIPWKIILGGVVVLFLILQGIKRSFQDMGSSVKKHK
jgi:hypothetical protein